MRKWFSIINGTSSLISQFFIIILGFISRTIFINCLGDEILGLNGTFTNILSILSVTELGVGSSVAFCLYKPVYEKDEKTIAGIMNLYKKAYFMIGIIIICLSIGVTPFLSNFIKGYTLDLNFIRAIFLLYAFNSTITYFLGSYRTMFFACQKNYVVTIVDFFTKLILQTAQIIVLLTTKNYVLYLLLVTICNISSNLIIYRLCYKQFPYLKNNKEKIDDESKKRIFNTIKYLSISSLISVGVFGTDNLIISSFIGITISGIYSNYTLIIQNIQTLFTSLLNGVTASLGNMIAEGNKEKINTVFNVYDFIYFLVASFTTVSLYALLEPFIGNIWIKKSEYVLPALTTVVLCVNNYMTFKRQPIWQYQNTSGIFKYFLPYSFMELIINIAVSVYLAQKVGLIGVFLGTTVAYIASWLGQTYVVHKYVLEKNVFNYYFVQVKYIILVVIETLIVVGLKNLVTISNPWLNFLYICLLCLIVPNGINIFLYRNSDEFIYVRDNILKKVLDKIRGRK